MCLKTLSRHSLLGGRQGDGFIWKADGNLLVSEEWVRGGMVRNASLVSFSTPCTNRRLSQGMPSEIVSAPCEPIPGTVRNVTHNNFSTFLCVCGTKRKNESENEKKKRGNIQECGFLSIIQLSEMLFRKSLQHIYVTSPAAYLRDSLSSTGIETTHTSHITWTHYN